MQSFGSKINGMYLFSRTKLIVHSGTTLYRGSLDGETLETLYNNMANNESCIFMFGDNLYIVDGQNYLKYDGTTVTEVKDEAYIPTTSVSNSPSGGGEKLDSVNCLTPQRINTFSGDGTSTVYSLDVDPNERQIDSVDEVKVNGVVLPSTDYTVDLTTNKVTFNSAPSTPAVLGQDNVSIKFTANVSGYLDRILNCKLATVFDNRIFFSGNEDYPNTVFHCALNNPAYIQDIAYYECGNSDNKIKSLVVGNNVLWVLKTDDQTRDTIFYMTPTTDTEYGRVYPTSQGNISIGCYSKGFNFKDNIVFFSKQGLEMMSGNIQYEQNITHASSMVDTKMINESNYAFLQVCEYKGFMLVGIDNRVYLADSRQLFNGNTGKEFEWYYWELPIRISCFNEVLGTLYIGDYEGNVYVLGGTNDNGKMIEAYWCTPRDFFGFVNHYKKTNKRGSIVKAKNIQNSKLKIAVKTNKDVDWKTVKEASTSGFDFNNIDFSSFSFTGGDSTYIIYRAKKKKFIDMQTKIYLDDVTEDGAVGICTVEIVGNNKLRPTITETQIIGNVTITPIYENGLLQYINLNGSTNNATGSIVIGDLDVKSGKTYTSSGASYTEVSFTTITDRYSLSFSNFGFSEAGALDIILNRDYTYSLTKSATAISNATLNCSIYLKGFTTFNNAKLYPTVTTDGSTIYEPYQTTDKDYSVYYNEDNDKYMIFNDDDSQIMYVEETEETGIFEPTTNEWITNPYSELETDNIKVRHINLDKPFGIALIEIENFLGGYAKR